MPPAASATIKKIFRKVQHHWIILPACCLLKIRGIGMTRLFIVAALTAVIHLINTLIYSVRLAGIRTQRLAIAISLFNVIFLVSSTANLIQAPLLSSIVEHAINKGLHNITSPQQIQDILQSPFYRQQLIFLQESIRLVIFSATVGTIAGALLIPTFVNVFTRAIIVFEKVGSVPRLTVMVFFSPHRLYRLFRSVYFPRPAHIRCVTKERLGIPKTFLLFNIVVTGIFTTGVLSALYAGALLPQFRSTATLLSGIVNGVAQILNISIVDPTAALITDQALRGERDERDVRQMAFYLVVTRFLGTLLAQAIFVPSAELIRFVAMLLI